jgi:hypothetical protein
VRGADRAAVDKRFRSPICCASAASLFGKSGKLSTATSSPPACWPLRSCSISAPCRCPWLVLRCQSEQRTRRRFGIGPRHASVEFHDRGSLLEGFVLKVVIRCNLCQKAGDTRGHRGHVDFIGFFGSIAWGHSGDTWGQAAGTMSPPLATTSSASALAWSSFPRSWRACSWGLPVMRRGHHGSALWPWLWNAGPDGEGLGRGPLQV